MLNVVYKFYFNQSDKAILSYPMTKKMLTDRWIHRHTDFYRECETTCWGLNKELGHKHMIRPST